MESVSRRAETVFVSLLDMDEVEREAALKRLQGEDPELAAEVRTMLGFLPAAEQFFEQFPAEEDRPPLWKGRRAGAYRITEEIGRGGMGAVYRGERDDGQFSLQVAIKFVSVLAAGGEAWKRFEQEKRILAGLRHPNIAQLLDGGVSAEGTPYIVMELVEGTSIDAYCRQQDLSVRSRIQLFLQVCDAVDFIHRNLIVHRDIKPGNILITVEGVPKLLDFGISRMLPGIADAEVTAPEHRLFTLNYSSPEQIRGDPVSTSSDIYSLGLLLYELLAGRPAFSLSGLPSQEILQQILDQDPPPPSLDEDLDKVVLKAVRKKPEQRYASVRELAADLQNYLSGRPVTAVEPTTLYRMRKWFGRHRAPVAAGTLAILALVAGAAGIVWQTRIARQQRAIAEQRFNEVRKLANSVIFEFQDGIATLAGATEVRRAMVARSLEYLDSLAKDARGNVDLLVELAAAYIRLGNIQGNAAVANLGDRPGAFSSYAKAKALLEEALRAEPKHRQALLNMGDLLTVTGYVLLQDGQRDKSLELKRQSVDHWERMARFAPQDETARSGLAGAYFAMATSTATWDERIRFWNLTWELYDEMLQASPADPRWMRNVALVHKYMSSMYMGELPPEQRDLDRGLQHAEKAVELDERRSAAMPDDAQARLDLAFSLSTLVSAWDRKGDLKKATAYATRSEEIRKALWEADPKNYQARDRLANALVRTADLYLRQGDRKSALQRLREAIEHTEALSRISQSWVTFDTTAWAHFDLARLYEESHSREVCPQWTRAARAVRRVVDAGNGSNYSNDQQRLQTIQTKLAQCGLKMPESDR